MRCLQDEIETWMLLEYCDSGALQLAVERGRISARNAEGELELVRHQLRLCSGTPAL